MSKKNERLGEAGADSHSQGPHELKAEHMKRTHGIIPRGSVPPPDAERKRPAKSTGKEKP